MSLPPDAQTLSSQYQQIPSRGSGQLLLYTKTLVLAPSLLGHRTCVLRGHRWTRLEVPIVAVEPALSPRGRPCVPLVPSTPHILLESAVCSLNLCRPPQRVNPSHYTVNTVQNRWQLGWMGPQRAQELLGASQSLCCPGRMPGHLAQGYIPGTCWARLLQEPVDSTVFGGLFLLGAWPSALNPGTSALPWVMEHQGVAGMGVFPLITVSVVLILSATEQFISVDSSCYRQQHCE